MARIACAHPGKIGDALYALPAMRALAERHGCKADFYTSSYCRPLTALFERQECVDRVVVSPGYVPRSFDCGGQPWEVPVPSAYEAIYQLGFRSVPDRSLPDFIAKSADLPEGLPVRYDFDPAPLDCGPYIVTAPRGPTTFRNLFVNIARSSPIPVIEVGAIGERTDAALDLTGRDMLETLQMMAGSVGFVGLMSSMLALANGLPIPRVAPHDGRSWDMRHVVRSPLNHYPVNPSAQQVLALLGLA